MDTTDNTVPNTHSSAGTCSHGTSLGLHCPQCVPTSNQQFRRYWVEGDLRDWDTREIIVGQLASEYTGPLVRLDEVLTYLKSLPVETTAECTNEACVKAHDDVVELLRTAVTLHKRNCNCEACYWLERSPLEPTANLGANIRHDGGIAICGWCGFALITNEPRQCCPQGQAYDAASTFRASEKASGKHDSSCVYYYGKPCDCGAVNGTRDE